MPWPLDAAVGGRTEWNGAFATGPAPPPGAGVPGAPLGLPPFCLPGLPWPGCPCPLPGWADVLFVLPLPVLVPPGLPPLPWLCPFGLSAPDWPCPFGLPLLLLPCPPGLPVLPWFWRLNLLPLLGAALFGLPGWAAEELAGLPVLLVEGLFGLPVLLTEGLPDLPDVPGLGGLPDLARAEDDGCWLAGLGLAGAGLLAGLDPASWRRAFSNACCASGVLGTAGADGCWPLAALACVVC